MILPDNDTLKYYGKKMAVGAAVSAGAVAIPGILLSVTGFASGGVVPGSMAAIWQSSIGNVAAGSIFAACQSAGAAGLSLTTIATLGTVGFVSTNARTVANGTVHGVKLLGSGISGSSKFIYRVVKSKL